MPVDIKKLKGENAEMNENSNKNSVNCDAQNLTQSLVSCEMGHPFISDAAKAKLLKIDGICGIGMGKEDSIVVFADNCFSENIPTMIEGKKVQIKLTGSIKTQKENKMT